MLAVGVCLGSSSALCSAPATAARSLQQYGAHGRRSLPKKHPKGVYRKLDLSGILTTLLWPQDMYSSASVGFVSDLRQQTYQVCSKILCSCKPASASASGSSFDNTLFSTSLSSCSSPVFRQEAMERPAHALSGPAWR